jgi:predicted secreted hydrolase
MKIKAVGLAAGVLLTLPITAQYRQALPGYRYEFPRDHFNHPEFQTEWWYYTGNLKSGDGHQFGFELTLFRQGVSRDVTKTGSWDVRDLYVAHLALSDLDTAQFYHAERVNRSGPGLAGVSLEESRVWNGNWQVRWEGQQQMLQAIDERFELHFTLQSAKPPVIHGANGISQKAEGAGRASHYISLTRLEAAGQIELNGQKFEVSGLAWMDHEFCTNQLTPEQVGWDWMGIQLEDNTELMLFRIRRKDGGIDPYSSGTFVDPQGRSTYLRDADFTIQPLGDTWISPASGAVYPIHWKISLPKLGTELELTTPLALQEISGSGKITPSYWEGAIRVAGRNATSVVGGVGYLEMTGYERPLALGRKSDEN